MATKGPIGGTDSKPPVVQFNDPALRIIGIQIWSGQYVDALQIKYQDTRNGAVFDGTKYGGSGGNWAFINFGNSNLAAIDIHAGRWIDFLGFYDNTRAIWSYGGNGGGEVGVLQVDDWSNQRIYDIGVGFSTYLNTLEIYYQ